MYSSGFDIPVDEWVGSLKRQLNQYTMVIWPPAPLAQSNNKKKKIKEKKNGESLSV